ncbi:MAG: hypothetical protein M3340_15410 [Actinomycetota bacterium]|nr:hypothetical protein [Actinomycetota bacterium]
MAGPPEVALEIVTTSQVSPTYKTPPTLPKITMNGNPFPTPGWTPSSLFSGWQLVVLDSSMDMTDPASIRVNNYIPLTPDQSGYWSDTYGWVYDGIGRALLSAGDLESQRVFLASYGWDMNAPPTAFMLQQLLDMGGGKGAQYWETHVDRGSENQWCSNPGCYILVGGSSYSYGEGHEVYDYPGTSPVTATLQVTLGNP